MNGMSNDTITGGAIAADIGTAASYARAREGRSQSRIDAWRRYAGPWLVVALVALLLAMGWQQREFRYITAETGVGYALGITGGVLMLALLLYPLRKRARFMSRLGTVRGWFRLHMLFGVFGPTLILLHSNFNAGSVNSTVALFSMLIVAASGVVGRFLYGRSHHGMLSQRRALQAIQAERHRRLRALSPLIGNSDTLAESLSQLQQRLIPEDQGLWPSLVCLFALNADARKTRRLARAEVKSVLLRTAHAQQWSRTRLRNFRRKALRDLQCYIALVTKVSQFDFYQRLFSLWHVLHLPLFILLVITGVFHVLAVHMY